MLEEYEVVKLIEDIPKENLKKGCRGTVLIVYPNITSIQHYEVEFMNDAGNSLAVLTLPETILEKSN